MSDLITRVRRNIDDLDTPPVFSDDEIQDLLDERRLDRYYERLIPQRAFAPGGAVLYRDYWSQSGGDWESDAEIVDATYTVLSTGYTADYTIGVWTFSPQRTDPYVLVSGRQYDVNGASADLLERWLSKKKLDFTFTRGRRQFQRQEVISNLEKAIELYRSKSWLTVTEMVRGDIHGGRMRHVGPY